MHVLEVRREPDRFVITVETDADTAGCRRCGVVAVGHGRRLHRAADAPCFGVPVVVRWLKRIWRCDEGSCQTDTFSEVHELIAQRAVLTGRAVQWATDALSHDDTTVSALARHLGVDWHTLWRAVKLEATRRTARPERLGGVRTLGVDEHIWRPSHHGADRAITAMVDLTRDEQGRLRARLLDVVPGRSGTVYAAWLREQAAEFVAGIEHAALDPFRGYANAIRDELPDAAAVLDAFHVVKLGTQVVDEVRRRVQQDTTGHRGLKDDPLYKIRGLLRHGSENLSPRRPNAAAEWSPQGTVLRPTRQCGGDDEHRDDTYQDPLYLQLWFCFDWPAPTEQVPVSCADCDWRGRRRRRGATSRSCPRCGAVRR